MSIIDFQNKQVSRLKLPEITDVNLITQSIDPVTSEGTCVYCPQDKKMYYSNSTAWITDLGLPEELTVVAPTVATDTNVLNISAGTIKAQFATTGLPGVLSAGAQNISGVKTWEDDVIAPRYQCNDTNIRVGNSSLTSTATTCIGLGNNCMQNATGNNNVGIGFECGKNISSGSENILVGAGTGFTIADGSNNIIIGNNLNGSTPGGINNNLVIGGTQTYCIVRGIRGITTFSPSAIPVLISSQGQLGTASSRRELKENISLIDEEFNHNIIMGLRANRFSMKSDESHRLTYGLIVDEVQLVEPDLISCNCEGDAETVMYQHIPILLLAEIQRLNKIVDNLIVRINILENK